MKRYLIQSFLFLLVCCFLPGQKVMAQSGEKASETAVHENDTLFRFFNAMYYEPGVPCGYTNQKGDTVIRAGKYFYCFTGYNY